MSMVISEAKYQYKITCYLLMTCIFKSLLAKNIFEGHFFPIFNNLFKQANLIWNFIYYLSQFTGI